MTSTLSAPGLAPWSSARWPHSKALATQILAQESLPSADRCEGPGGWEAAGAALLVPGSRPGCALASGARAQNRPHGAGTPADLQTLRVWGEAHPVGRQLPQESQDSPLPWPFPAVDSLVDEGPGWPRGALSARRHTGAASRTRQCTAPRFTRKRPWKKGAAMPVQQLIEHSTDGATEAQRE